MITRFKNLPNRKSIEDYKTIFKCWRLVLSDLIECGKLEARTTEQLFEAAEILTDHICKIPNYLENDLKIDSVYMTACNHYSIEYKSGDYCGMMCDLIKTRY